MATEFINGQWRIPNDWDVDQSNQDKISNYSMDFNGVSDKIEFGNINGFERTDSFTFSLWVNITSYAGTYYYISKQLATGVFRGYLLFSGTGGELQFLLNSTFDSSTLRVNSSSQIPLNQWVHLVLTYDGSSSASGVNMYFNSVLQTIITVNDNLTTSTLNTTEFQISGRDGGNGNLVGKIDQVSVFDYALSQAQVTTLYGNSAAGYFQIGNPMALTPLPLTFYPLGDQDLIGAGSYNGANWLIPNQVAGTDSLVFNFSATQFIGCGNNSSINQVGTVFTMACWVNTTSQVRGSIMGTFNTTNYGGYFIELMANGTVFGGFNSNLFNSRAKFSLATVDDGNWHHVCYTISGTNTSDINVYIDGVASNGTFSQQGTPANANTTNSFQINNQSTSSSARYIGLTSNVQVFTATLTGPEVSTLYNNGIPLLSLSSIPQNSSLQGWWKLNETTTLIAGLWVVPDDSANTNGGLSSGMTESNRVLSNLPKAAGGYSPYAIDLDGTDETFVVDNSSEDFNLDYLSISMWFNPDVDANQTIINNCFFTSGNMGWGIKLSPDKRIRFISVRTGNNYVTGQEYNINEWNHIAVTYDNATGLTLYLNNGTPVNYQIAGSGGNAPLFYTNGALIRTGVTIGSAAGSGSVASPGPPSQFFNGQLSNVAVWGSGLSAAQVSTTYNNGIPGDISSLNPLAWWELGSMMGFNGVNTYTALSNTDSNFAAVSTANMDAANVVNGPGYSDGGLGTSSLVIKEQAPYSFNNGLSENMAISNRDDSQASDPYPYIFELDLSGESNPFTWDSPSMNTLNTFPFTVDWGDGTVESIALSDLVSNRLQHVYDTSAYPRPVIQYGRADDVGQVFTTGASGSQPTASRNVVRFIKQIGNIPWKQLRFYQYANATSKVQLTDIPDFSGAGLHAGQTSFASLMYQSSKLNIANISEWDVSTITTASSMFYQANLPSQDFSKWDTSSQRAGQSAPGILNLLQLTFTTNKAFNGDVTNWFTTRATSASQTFSGCTVFNQDVSTKYISAASSPTGADYVAWDTKNITNMASMFANAKAFNQDISNWDTSNVTRMSTMFSGANAFNQDISTKQVTVNGVTYTAWDVSKVTTLVGILLNTSFDNTLDNWELNGSLTNMTGIFSQNNSISDENFSDNYAIFANSVKDDNSPSGGAASNFPKNVSATITSTNAKIRVSRTAPLSTGGTRYFDTCGEALSYLTSDVKIAGTFNAQDYTADFLQTPTSSYPTKIKGVTDDAKYFEWDGTTWKFFDGTTLHAPTGTGTLNGGPVDGYTWDSAVIQTLTNNNQNWNFTNNASVVYIL